MPSEPQPVSVTGLLYGALAVGLLAVGLGWFVARGPAAVRRPLLTPAVLGVLCGLITHALRIDAAPHVRRWMPLAAVSLALGAMHLDLFRQIQLAAAERAATRPGELLGLQLHEHTATDDPASEPSRRKLRLALRPAWRDYLTERASVLVGEVPWPTPVVLVSVEVLLAAAIGTWLAHRVQAGSEPPQG